ncbi:hypothetical protein ACFC0S_00090 [Streptomyces sp. NPDC056084]|uniref:hypothetical protein n=1 Tax=unclassified Streptomyces TaxID=2593676 RepID=UPI0035DF86B5
MPRHPRTGKPIDTYTSPDLDDMTAEAALDAVIADIRSHPGGAGPGGFFTALRHIDLISHLALRFAGDAVHHLDEHRQTGTPWHPVEALTTAAVPLSRAQYHYTHAMAAIAAVGRPNTDTSMAAHLDGLEHRSTLHSHLRAVEESLAEARRTLTAPVPAPPRTASTIESPAATPSPGDVRRIR